MSGLVGGKKAAEKVARSAGGCAHPPGPGRQALRLRSARPDWRPSGVEGGSGHAMTSGRPLTR